MNIANKWKLCSPAESDGGAEGAPAGEEAGSEEVTEETFEFAEDYDDDVIPEEEDVISQKADEEGEGEEESGEEEESDDTSGEEESEEEPDAEEEEEPEAEEEGNEEEKEEEEPPKQLTEEEITQMREDFISQTAENFTFTEEEIDGLRTEPEKVLPKLLAKAQVQALESAVQMMRHNLPELVRSQLTANQTAMTAEKKFFGKFPELKTSEAQKVAERMAKAYRTANPEAGLDEIIDNVGYMTWRQLGLPLEGLMKKMGDGMEETFEAADRSKGKKTKGKGFSPEGAGKVQTAKPAASADDDNEYVKIAEMFLNDDNFDDD